MNKVSSFVFLFVIIIYGKANALSGPWTCSKFIMNEITTGKTTPTKLDGCYYADYSIIISKNCKELECQAFSNVNRYTIDEIMSPMGTPGFHLCDKLGGKGRLVTYTINKKEIVSDYCLFSDGSFTNMNAILSYYLVR